MANITTISIGGRQYDLPEMTFAAVERAWPYVEEATAAFDPIKGTAAGLCIIASTLIEAEDFDKTRYGMTEADEMLSVSEQFDRVVYFFKKQLKAKEIGQVKDAVLSILTDADLIKEDDSSGEVEAGTENPSTETVPASSPSSLPQGVREEVGGL